MKVSLRDFFWLILFGATLTVWIVEHRKAAKEIAECRQKSWFLRTDRGMKPTGSELKRRAAVKTCSQMTDDELDACLAECLVAAQAGSPGYVRYDPCLLEMAHRQLAERLQKHYDITVARYDGEFKFRRIIYAAELLTALRRAQGKADPLSLTVKLGSRPPWAEHYAGPCLQVIIKNEDVFKESVWFEDGGDDRGGRRERWRFQLTDDRGNQVLDSNYAPMMGGGVSSCGPLAFGDTGSRFNFFELRKYVAPPQPGRYTLRVFYHNNVSIADERDTSSLIVFKSEPISVIVHNPSPRSANQRRSDSRRPLTVLAGCAVLAMASVVSRMWRSDWNLLPISRRDTIWCALIVSLAIGMWLDQRHQSKLIVDVRPDAAAQWSIRLADEAQP